MDEVDQDAMTSKDRPSLTDMMNHFITDSPEYSEILAVEVGGSVGRDESDDDSDLDFFIYVRRNSLHSFVEEKALDLLRALVSPWIFHGPEYKENFGWTFTGVQRSHGCVSIIVRDETQLEPNYMRGAGGKIAHDPANLLRRSLAQSALTSIPTVALARSAMVDSYIKIMKVAKEISRGNDWQARKYYRQILENATLLVRVITGVPPRGRSYRHPGRGMEREIPQARSKEIRRLETDCMKSITPDLIIRTTALMADLATRLDDVELDINWNDLGRRTAGALRADSSPPGPL
ncbi:hypothetical protein ACSDR0_25200 [Streptosporangium sp. G11]|uniref:hypothetical protein n=1 Tax=Streptosporangium sp. G11 TaxID=3436926 RepID=UPI003EBBE48D